MNDPKESLKRVLMGIKGKAREMRKGNLEARMRPKPKIEEPPEEEIKPLEVPEEALLGEDSESPDDKKAEKDREKLAIKKLLARS